jgi:DNA-binding LacI/PurR family transcriptional regulator
MNLANKIVEPNPSRRATIKDVAESAGVSLATVSRALNESGFVKPATSELVWEAARSLGFRPNLMGRNLRSSRTQTLGVMLPTLIHPVFAECLQSIETAARLAQHTIALSTTDYDPLAEEAASEALLRQRVDGLILTVADAASSPVLDKLDAEGVPYVLVFNQMPRQAGKKKLALRRPCVSVDNQLAAQQMVKHLIDQGHRSICMIAGQFGQSDRSRLRFNGYRQAMLSAGLEPIAPLELSFNQTDTRRELQDLLSSRARPTALFCSSDQIAMAVMRDARQLGFDVPGDLSVAGFDGVRVGQLLSPELTTVVQPTSDIGRTAVDLLLQLINGEQYLGPALLHHTLRLGGSVSVAR